MLLRFQQSLFGLCIQTVQISSVPIQDSQLAPTSWKVDTAGPHCKNEMGLLTPLTFQSVPVSTLVLLVPWDWDRSAQEVIAPRVVSLGWASPLTQGHCHLPRPLPILRPGPRGGSPTLTSLSAPTVPLHCLHGRGGYSTSFWPHSQSSLLRHGGNTLVPSTSLLLVC